MQLDIDRLIAYFGGVNALAEALKQQDPEHAASTAAIYKWRTRGSLPLAQLQKLTALAQAQGRPFQTVLLILSSYIEVLQPQSCRNKTGLGCSPFARHY